MNNPFCVIFIRQHLAQDCQHFEPPLTSQQTFPHSQPPPHFFQSLAVRRIVGIMFPKLSHPLLLLSLLVLQNDGFSLHVGLPRRAPHVISQLMTLESKNPVRTDVRIDGADINSSAKSPVSVDSAVKSGMALVSDSQPQGLDGNKELIPADVLSKTGGNLNPGTNGQPESVVDSVSKLDANTSVNDSESSTSAGSGILSTSGQNEQLSSGNNDSSVGPEVKFENAEETSITSDIAISDDLMSGVFDGTSNSLNNDSLNVETNIKDVLLNSSLFSESENDGDSNHFEGFLGLDGGNVTATVPTTVASSRTTDSNGSEEIGKSCDQKSTDSDNTLRYNCCVTHSTLGAVVDDNGNDPSLRMLGKIQDVVNSSEENTSEELFVLLDKDNSENPVTSNDTIDLYLEKSSELLTNFSEPVAELGVPGSSDETGSSFNSDETSRPKAEFFKPTQDNGTASKIVDASDSHEIGLSFNSDGPSRTKAEFFKPTQDNGTASKVVDVSSDSSVSIEEWTELENTESITIPSDVASASTSELATNVDFQLLRLLGEKRRFSTEDTNRTEVTDIQMFEETGSSQTGYVGAEGVTSEPPSRVQESGEVNLEMRSTNQSVSSDLENLESTPASGAERDELVFDDSSEIDTSGRFLVYPSDSIKLNDSMLGIKPNPITILKEIDSTLSFMSSTIADDVLAATTVSNSAKNTGSILVFRTSTPSPVMVNTDQHTIAPIESTSGPNETASNTDESFYGKHLKHMMEMFDYDSPPTDVVSPDNPTQLSKRALDEKLVFGNLFPDINSEPDSFAKYEIVSDTKSDEPGKEIEPDSFAKYEIVSDTKSDEPAKEIETDSFGKYQIVSETKTDEPAKVLNASESSTNHSQIMKKLFVNFLKCYEQYFLTMTPEQVNMSRQFGDFLRETLDEAHRCYDEAEKLTLTSENGGGQRLTVQDMMSFTMEMALAKNFNFPELNMISLLTDMLPTTNEDNSRPPWVTDDEEDEIIDTFTVGQGVEIISNDDNDAIRETSVIRPSEDMLGLGDRASDVHFGPVSQEPIDKEPEFMLLSPEEFLTFEPRKESGASTAEPLFYHLDEEGALPDEEDTPLLDSNVPGDLPSIVPDKVTRSSCVSCDDDR